MKIIRLFLALMLFGLAATAQGQNLYNPEANAKEDVAKAVKQAKAENKHVFLQIGGNWCPWCIKFHNFVNDNAELKKLVENNFVTVKVNYSPENRNYPLLEELEYPQRFGFPVFLVLDGNGARIHTQNSGILEKDNGYDIKLVTQFFNYWTPAALDPAKYNK